MTNYSNVCAWGTSVGAQRTCGCQSRAPLPAASCHCGDVCTRRTACTCKDCRHANARQSESGRRHGSNRAHTSIHAIRDVVHAVRSSAASDKSL
jgi:hypothetical protein